MRTGKKVGEAIERYQREYDTGPSVQSICGRLDRELGGYELSATSPDIVNTWKAKRLKEAAPATVRMELSVLKRVFNLATDQWEWIDRNRVKVVENPRVSNSRERWLSQDEEDTLVASCPSWLAYIVSFIVQTGLRKSEATDLEWSDVHLDNGYMVLKDTKEKRPRGIPLSPKARNILKALGSKKEGYVFLDELNRRITSSHIEYSFSIFVKKSGLSNLHLHDLRHTFASRLVQRGESLYHVQSLLGHRSPVTTMRYAHLSLQSLQRAVDRSV